MDFDILRPWGPVAVLLSWTAMGCLGPRAVERPTAAQARAAGVSLELANDGRARFIERCGACHDLPSPRSRPPQSWPAIVAAMATRTKLDTDTMGAIEAYLMAAASPEGPGDAASVAPLPSSGGAGR